MRQPSTNVDQLKLLVVEAQVIWAGTAEALGSGTVSATLLSADGRSAVLSGEHPVGDDMAVVTTHASRSWLLSAGVESPQLPPGLEIVDSGVGWHPPARWPEAEWSQLVRGELGPWAAVVAGTRVVSLAHSARLTPLGLEVGVQTEDDHRGRNLAAIAVLAWARNARDIGLPLFYSATETNGASHRVAAKVGGLFLGMMIHAGLR